MQCQLCFLLCLNVSHLSVHFSISGTDIHTNMLCRSILCCLAWECGHLSGEWRGLFSFIFWEKYVKNIKNDKEKKKEQMEQFGI